MYLSSPATVEPWGAVQTLTPGMPKRVGIRPKCLVPVLLIFPSPWRVQPLRKSKELCMPPPVGVVSSEIQEKPRIR